MTPHGAVYKASAFIFDFDKTYKPTILLESVVCGTGGNYTDEPMARRSDTEDFPFRFIYCESDHKVNRKGV